jgi:cardiolipin synthase
MGEERKVMRNLFKLVFRRIGLVSICILLQLAAIYLASKWVVARSPWISGALTVLSWVVILFILSDRTNISYKLAWIIPILAFPVFGLVLYLIFGGNRLSARLRRKMQSMNRMLHDNLRQDIQVSEKLGRKFPDAVAQSHYLTEVSFPVYGNTQTRYYPSGETCWAAMLDALRAAEKTIYLEYFIIAPGRMWDTIVDILEQKAARGVDVRLIYDDFGCIQKLPIGYRKTLEAKGIRVFAFNPYIPVLSSRLNNRDHRKLMIIDGTVAFTGGINHADEYINEHDRHCGHWKDCGIELRGDAVWSLTVMFYSMWNHISGAEGLDVPPQLPPSEAYHGYVQPFADSPLDFETVSRNVFLNLITRAKKSVYVMTPYLIIDDTVSDALSIAAKSGIDVRIITPAIGDKAYIHMTTRAYYVRLLEAGCRIYEYTPGFVHSKLMLVDGTLAVVGTVNLDFRSMYLHFENGIWLCDADCIHEIETDFSDTFKCSRPVSPAECNNQHWYMKLARAFLRVFSPLM